MDRDTAKFTATAALRSASDFMRILPVLKEQLAEDDYRQFASGIGEAAYGVTSKFMERAFGFVPQLRTEFDKKIAKFGRVF